MKLFAALSAPLMVCLLSAAPGCAAANDGDVGSATADLSAAAHPAPAVTVSQLEKAIADEDNWLPNADGCTFSSKKQNGGGLELTLTADGGTVTLEIVASAKVTMKDKSNGDDGFVTYTIAHVGTVEIEHADDAFVRFALTSDKTGTTSTCEEDF
jgi:hypothetical protein